MEKMNLSFKIDGREIAKVIMNERLETVNKRRKLMNEVRRDLGIILSCKVLWNYSGDYFQFNIYNEEKQNDYKIIIVKRFENEEELSEKTLCSISMIYVNEVYKKYINDNYKVHEASIIENVVIDMLEENKTDDVYIMDGLLIYEDLEFCLEDIKEYHVYTGEECIMRIYDELDGWYVIDFINGTIQEELN